MRAAPELLGAPTTGGGSARPRGGGGEIPRSHINLHSSTKLPKTVKKRAVSRSFSPIKRQKRRFSLIST